MRRFVCLLLLCSTAGLAAQPDPLAQMLARPGKAMRRILADPARYEVQILYTQIDRDSANHPHFTSWRYRVDPDAYFYPASTVKLPAALMALEQLNTLAIDGLDKYSVMLTDSAFSGQIRVLRDTSAAGGLPSAAHYIKKILLVSDNDAFNRLYEFTGQGPLHEGLLAKGYEGVRIVHRLERTLSAEQNRCTNPVRFFRGDSLVYSQPARCNGQPIPHPPSIPKGTGYYQGDTLVQAPFEFAGKNCLPLETQQEMLKAVLFPESVPPQRRFQLTEEDYRFLWRYLALTPRESRDPRYDPRTYPDGWVKFFRYGGSRPRIPRHIRIFNKVGDAYGYLIDNAYLADFRHGTEFLLSAVVLVNEDGIFNDDRYAYETLGFPFFEELGKRVYRYERKRKRAFQPDLSRFEAVFEVQD
ncbi:MAG: serine hydrolase [Bacteroidia bacterium]|nr:serine hydrolase [Bacteroidia bacterium]